MPQVTRKQLQEALADADFPADKDSLLADAERRDADEDVRKALRGLPPVDYRNLDEVVASVGADVGSGRGAAPEAVRKRQQATSPVAEPEREAPPGTPPRPF